MAPYTRRRRDRGGNRFAAALRGQQWRIGLFLVAMLVTCVNMNRLMSDPHAEHVTKGIQRHLPKNGSRNASSVRTAAGSDATEALPRQNAADQKLRGKQQVQLPRTTGGNSGYTRRCHLQEHAEYTGEVVKWGSDHLQVTPGP